MGPAWFGRLSIFYTKAAMINASTWLQDNMAVANAVAGNLLPASTNAES